MSSEFVTAKADRRLLVMLLALLFLIICALTCAAGLFVPNDFISAAAIAAACIFLGVSYWMILYWKRLSYELHEEFIAIDSGVVFRKRTYIYFYAGAGASHYSLPFSCGFSVLRVAGASAVILNRSFGEYFTEKAPRAQRE